MPTPGSPVRATTSVAATAAASTSFHRSRQPGPNLLHDHSWAGAEAYVEDYLERLDAAWTTPQPSLLDNRASKTCGTCANFRDAAVRFARNGQRHEAPMLVVSRASVTMWRPTVHVTADLRQPRHDIVDKRGRRVESVEGGRAFLYVQLSYRGRWWIDEIVIHPVNDDGTHRDR